MRSFARLASLSRPAFSRGIASSGQISIKDGKLIVPDNPILPFIEGDGTGPDIWRASVRVFDAAVKRAYNGDRKIQWLKVLAGEEAFNKTGNWLPTETLDAYRKYLVGIKGPLTTPVGGGIRSLNVALRQELDLYVCLRPVMYFAGVPSPVKHPEKVDMIIFRENTEDIYAGIEFQAGTAEAKKLYSILRDEFKAAKGIRFPENCGLGIKPISKEGSERLIASALDYALLNHRRSLTIVHKGNIMKFTEGAFKDWGYALCKSPKFREHVVTERESWILGNKDSNPNISDEANAVAMDPGYPLMTPAQQKKLREEVASTIASIGPTHLGGRWKKKLMVKDAIADICMQQVLTRADEFDVIATMNLNGDYLSDALAAQVGGIGIAPGGNINYKTGHAIFEATHGTAPKYANLDKVNPGSVILSGEMMFRHLGWNEVADSIIKAMNTSIQHKKVTYDFERQMKGATLLKCSEFADEIIRNL